MKVLVTGGAGFLGSALVTELKKQGHSVRALLRRKETAFNLDGLEVEIFICDMLNKEKLDQSVQGVEVVFHTAAIFKAYPFYDRHAKEIYTTNIEGTRNICEAALKVGVKKIIYTSSTAVIGKRDDGLPADENIKLNLLHKRSHYEKAKARAEEVALSYSDKGIQVVSINPSFIFGIRDSRPTPTGEMVVKFLNRVYPCYFDAILSVSSLNNVVEAHIKALEKGQNGERYIVAQQHHYTLAEIFKLLEDISGIKRPRIKLPISFLYIFSILNELIIALFGLGNRINPIIASELVRYLTLKAQYASSKARSEFGITDEPMRNTLKSAVDWYMRNGYIRRSSRIIYYRKIGKL